MVNRSVNQSYFEPPSRLQLLDKLQHFVRFSDFLLVVTGEKGVGKTTLVSQLQPAHHDSTLCCCTVRPGGPIGDKELLTSLMAQLPSHDNGGTGFADQLKVFHLQLKALHSSGQKCLILVDDAHHLSDEALELLLNLHAAESTDQSGAQLLLLGTPNLEKRLQKNRLVKSMEGRVHLLMLEGMSEEETAEYIELFHPESGSLDDKALSSLIKTSKGIPGNIATLLAGQVHQRSLTADQRPSAFPLPAFHMAGIAVLLLAIVAISLWQFYPESVEEEQLIAGKGQISLPLNLADRGDSQLGSSENNERKQLLQNRVTTKDLSDEVVKVKQDLAARLYDQELKRKKNIQSSASQEVVKIDEADRQLVADFQQVLNGNKAVDELKENKSVPAEAKRTTTPAKMDATTSNFVNGIEGKESKSEVSTKSVVKAEIRDGRISQVITSTPKVSSATSIAASKDEQELLSWPVKAYTLQMLGARMEKSAREFIQQQKDPQSFYYFSTIYKGKPWFVVVYGQYGSRDVANSAIRKLPPSLRKVRPWARSVQGVQLEIRKKNIN